jgi:hypothetical protein
MALLMLFCAPVDGAELSAGDSGGAGLGFIPDGKGFRFDTGKLTGRLRAAGRSQGLSDVKFAGASGGISASMGLFSHYRLLDDRCRYGGGAWDWESDASLTADGAVEVKWKEDEGHPFTLQATYRWKSADTLELVTRVRAGREMKRFEVFLASYLTGFGRSFVMGKEGSAQRFVEANESEATWHLFPRGPEVIPWVQDGRWKREPNPVAWTIRTPYALPMAMRVDDALEAAVVVMADPRGCFAVATPFGAEAHRSLYLSLFGRDLAVGETAEVKARLVVGRRMGETIILDHWRRFAQELGLDEAASRGAR